MFIKVFLFISGSLIKRVPPTADEIVFFSLYRGHCASLREFFGDNNFINVHI